MESTTQIFLRVQISNADDDTVQGENLVEGYADRMQIDSFTFGMSAKEVAPVGSHKDIEQNLDLDPVIVTKYFDRASTSLATLLKNKTRLEEVRITIDQQLEERGVGKAQNAILVFHLADARVIDFKLQVSEEKAGATMKETVSFTFRNFSVEYYFKSKGSADLSDYRDGYVNYDTNYKLQDD